MYKSTKIEVVGGDKNIIYEVNPIETFIGRSQLCNMTEDRTFRSKG